MDAQGDRMEAKRGDDREDPCQEVRLLGRLEGERFDRELRERERRQREERLARLAFAADHDALLDGGAGAVSPGAVARLQRDVERLAAFHDAVVRSKAWRIIQALRRLFGRAW